MDIQSVQESSFVLHLQTISQPNSKVRGLYELAH
jgi:hypothetical protein